MWTVDVVDAVDMVDGVDIQPSNHPAIQPSIHRLYGVVGVSVRATISQRPFISFK